MITTTQLLKMTNAEFSFTGDVSSSYSTNIIKQTSDFFVLIFTEHLSMLFF